MSGFNYEKDANGVVTVTMDMEGPVNSMSSAFLPLLRETVEKLESEAELTGVVLTSAKKTFFAGGDLNSLNQVTPETAETFSMRHRRSRPTCVAWRNWANRLWRRLMVLHWGGDLSWHFLVIIALLGTIKRDS